MKKVFLLLLALAFVPVHNLEARQMNANEALKRALGSGRMRSPSRNADISGDFKLVMRGCNSGSLSNSGDNIIDNIYVYNRAANGGYMVISGDDGFTPVLAYTDSGSFDWSNMPSGVRYMLDMYDAEISSFREHESYGGTGSIVFPNIEPLVNAKWDQGRPYNLKTPLWGYDDSGHLAQAVTGCVATAMAQVMYFHQWPQDGNFDWNSMLSEYIEGNYTDVQAEAVATLMAACGKAVNMEYGIAASGANSDILPEVFSKTFNYEKNTIRKVSRDNITLDSVTGILVRELNEKRPVIVSASPKNGEGHAFVLDGCNSDGYFHINWGWGGAYDGYFLISALSPSGYGAGGNAGVYNYGQSFLVGIQKAFPVPGDYNDEYAEVIAGGDIHYVAQKSDIWGVPSRIGFITTNGRWNGFKNKSIDMESLQSGCKFINKENGKIFYEWSSDEIRGWKLGLITSVLYCDVPYVYANMTDGEVSLPAGHYDVYPILRVLGSDKIMDVKTPMGMKQCIEMEISGTGTAVIIDEPKESGLKITGISMPEVIYQADEMTIGFKASNNAGEYYLGDINIGLKSIDSGEIKEVSAIMSEFHPGEGREMQISMELGVENENCNYRFIFTDLRGKIIGESEIFALAGFNPAKMIKLDETNFPDPVFMAFVDKWCDKVYDKDGRGYLSEKERRSIKAIDLGSHGNVTSLKGIEFFPEVEHLNVSGSFTDVNLESCKVLSYIALHGHLETLTLGEQPELEALLLSDNNIKSINLERCPKLKTVHLSNNKLETLILGEKPYLEELYAWSNNLEELDLEDCPALKKLNLNGNKMRVLTLGYKPYLESLDVYGQNLERVDIENSSALKYINLGNNKLQILNLGAKPLLETLILYYNNLTELSLENMPVLSTARLENNELKRLVVNDCSVLESLIAGFNEISQIEIIASPGIKELDLSYNKIENINVSMLSELETLGLGNNCLKSLDVSNNSRLKSLYVSSNLLTGIDLSHNPELIVFQGGGRVEVETESDGSFDLNELCRYGFDFTNFIPDGWCKSLLDETGTKIRGGSEFSYNYQHNSPNKDVIGESMHVTLVLTPKNPSGIEDVRSDKVTFRVSMGTVEFINKAYDESVEMYNISGQMLYRGHEATVSGLAPGIYIGKVGNHVFKISVP